MKSYESNIPPEGGSYFHSFLCFIYKGRKRMSTLYKKIKEYWTDRAEGYSKVNQDELSGSQNKDWERELLGKIKNTYKDREYCNIKVLDIGCGPGFFSIVLARNGFKVTAIDAAEAMLDKARHNAGRLGQKINFIKMDAQNLEFESGSFDVVISRNLTWVLENPQKAYEAWLNVLAEGGLLLNYDANWYGYLYNDEKRLEYERDRENVASLQIEDHYTCTDIDAMEKIALKVPLSGKQRPKWDIDVLSRLPVKIVSADLDVWKHVWSDIEKVNYASTPMFGIMALKQTGAKNND